MYVTPRVHNRPKLCEWEIRREHMSFGNVWGMCVCVYVMSVSRLLNWRVYTMYVYAYVFVSVRRPVCLFVKFAWRVGGMLF